ncbi:hypothetical protein SAMN05216257_10496 [Meinhardsimonia xiamenensis]|jgi:hypothetical protein|uniref:Uncharacterized protein n=1 Tax=Meinhardsimonia xiamenensis TaxID=990712 RepID=A0A1G9E039_9RHOB|nr:hypothetical protein [Meinhardsimonia xiamenensis]PRX29015.1 hypothetical protein LV81_02959 [Meinhardsimonia xiamenensis]SDK69501.1 hypothetical protein SAMN05216257_10496 [Meinhardsimonia xiamenensis]
MGVTKAEFAALRGVSRAAVNKAIASGRISLEPDGSIDPERAMREWDANTDPAKQRGVHAGKALSPEEKERRRREAEQRRLERVARRAENFTEEQRQAVREFDEAADARERAGARPGVAPGAGIEGAGGIDINKARTAKTFYEAQLMRQKFRQQEGELVPREAAEKMVTALARRVRDALLAWPTRVSAEMAAELGVEARELEQVLERALWDFLAEQSEVKVKLGGDGRNAAG